MRYPESDRCPVCAEPMDGQAYALKDGWVCAACVRELRFAYPVTYLPNPHPFESRRPDLREVFPESAMTSREKADLIEELRDLPLNRADPSPKAFYTVDRMHALTVLQFREQRNRAAAIRRDLQARYDDYDHICTVARTAEVERPSLREGIPKIRKYLHTVAVFGTIRLGSFRIGDWVTILRQGRPLAQAEVIELCEVEGCVSDPESQLVYGVPVSRAEEGHQVNLILSPQAGEIAPGDLLVMDE